MPLLALYASGFRYSQLYVNLRVALPSRKSTCYIMPSCFHTVESFKYLKKWTIAYNHVFFLTHYFNEERSRPYLDLSRSWRKRVLPTFVFHFSNKYIRKREVVLKLIPVILSISYLDYYNLCCAWQLACETRRRISDILGINAAVVSISDWNFFFFKTNFICHWFIVILKSCCALETSCIRNKWIVVSLWKFYTKFESSSRLVKDANK